jgi:hypothetical protein
MSHRAPLQPLSAALILLTLLALITLVGGCGKANPVAPSGSTITLSANPAELPSPTGTSTITAVVRKPNGTVAAGVDVRFTTTIGTIDVLKQTDSGGIATAALHGDGRSGTASVSAAVDGGGTAMALMVPIAGGAKTITLQAIPANIANTGGVVTLIALVRDSLGQPAPDVRVNFTTTVGTLASKGGFRKTNGSGQATDTLTVLGSDLTNQTSITVTATAAASDGTLQVATAMVAVVNPNAAASVSVSASPGQIPPTGTTGGPPITVTAIVLNAQGVPIKGALVIFSTTLGTLKPNTTSTDSTTGVATSKLTVDSAPPSSTITVTAQSPGVGGALVTGTTTITVTQQ